MSSNPKELPELDDELFDSLLQGALEQRENEIDEQLRVQSRDLDTSQLQRQIMRGIKREQRKLRAAHWLQRSLQLYKNAAAIFVFILIVSIIVVGSVNAARVSIFQWIAERTTEYFVLSDDIPSSLPSLAVIELPEGWQDFYAPSYLPPGFRLANSYGNTRQRIIVYENASEQEIVFWQGEKDTLAISGDGEDAEVREVTISGYPAMLVEKDALVTLYWTMGEVAFNLAGELPEDELIRIAENLRRIE